MPQPNSRDLYVSRPLTNISVAFQQGQADFVADVVFPQVPVQRQGDLYYKYKRDDWFRSQAGVRAPATETPGGGWEVETDNYFSAVYGVHKDLDDQVRANADSAFNLDRDATLWVTTNLLLKREQLFMSKYMTTGVWGTDLTGVSGSPSTGEFKQFDVAGSDPISVVTNARLTQAKSTGFPGNVLVMGASVEQALLNHSTILDRIKYTQRGVVSRDLLASLFGVDRIVVPMAIQNTAPKGATGSYGLISDNDMLLAYTPANPGLLTPAAGYIFTWNGLLGGGAYGTRIKRFRMEAKASDRIEGEMAFDMKVVSPEMGTYFDSVVS